MTRHITHRQEQKHYRGVSYTKRRYIQAQIRADGRRRKLPIERTLKATIVKLKTVITKAKKGE